jgi:hypothetical protein
MILMILAMIEKLIRAVNESGPVPAVRILNPSLHRKKQKQADLTVA